jgi:alpha-D-xyloside xylohydrolase
VVFAGKTDEIIASYRQLSGAAPMMPIWSLGYIHCRERYKSQNEIIENLSEFRNRKLPMDLIVQDWQYWGKYGWNAMQFDEKDYPDPAKMVQDIHQMNARLMVSVWSKIDEKSDLGKEFAARNFYIPNTQWVDFFNPAAADFYWKNFSEKLLKPYQIDAWWQDATEPENDDLRGRRINNGTQAGETMRNIYPLFVTKTVYEGSRLDVPDKRVFILTRSAFPGTQRYAAAVWSGDIGNDWETLRRQITAGLNLSVTGMPYWTVDAGGFFRPGNGQYTDSTYHERFLRWFQFGTFCPLQRVHGYKTDTEFWRFGEKVEKEALKYLNLRYRMLPYIYSQAAAVTFDGGTIMRPLVMDFSSDRKALGQNYEYMFGPSILVAPVLAPDVKTWDVYLPENKAGWYNFWTGKKSLGGQTVKTAAPIGQIPLFVKAGSIVPFGPEKQYTSERADSVIELRVYAGADATFKLYEDDGVSYNYEHDKYATILIQWNDLKKELVIGERKGEFEGMLKNRKFEIVLVDKKSEVGMKVLENQKTINYLGKKILISLK